MANWLTTTGKVLASSVESYRGRASGRPTTNYRPAITYEYHVNGQKYVGLRYSQNPMGTGFQSAAQKIVDRYPPCADITVTYNADDPADAFLEKGLGIFGNKVLLIVGGIVLVMTCLPALGALIAVVVSLILGVGIFELIGQ